MQPINKDAADLDDVPEYPTTRILATIAEDVDVGEFDLNVRDTPVGTKIGVNPGGKSHQIDPLELRMVREFIDRYEDLLVALADTDGEGVDLWWQVGEAIEQHVGDDEDLVYTWLAAFGDVVGLDERDFSYADKIHSVFDSRDEIPDSDWSDDTWVGRLAGHAETKAEAQALIETFDDKPSKRDIRLWKEFRGDNDPDAEEVVAEAKRRFKAKYGYSDGTWVKKTRNVYRILGTEPPERDTIYDAIEATE